MDYEQAASENSSKPLQGLQHTVYGNGDETYMDTCVTCRAAQKSTTVARRNSYWPHSVLSISVGVYCSRIDACG